jgi:aminoglycoside phosphotransferase (APT) family kinase protein
MVNNEAALIDWDTARVGPPSIDLWFVAETHENPNEVELYHRAFCGASPMEVTPATINEWLALGECYSCFFRVCFYLAVRECGLCVDPTIYRRIYGAALRRLDVLARRYVSRTTHAQ